MTGLDLLGRGQGLEQSSEELGMLGGSALPQRLMEQGEPAWGPPTQR